MPWPPPPSDEQSALNLLKPRNQMNNQLTKNFTISELVKSQTAVRHGISNMPTDAHLANMKAFCRNYAQHVRDYLNAIMSVTSGYRSQELNDILSGSSANSMHMMGLAIDFHVNGQDCYMLFNDIIRATIRGDIPEFDQLILEQYDPGTQGEASWIHVAWKPEPRNKIYTAYRTENLKGKRQTFYEKGAVLDMKQKLKSLGKIK